MTPEEIKNLRYDDALEKLREISQRLENKEVSMDDLTQEVKTANLLAEHCKAKLRATESEIKRILEVDE
ncbi:MAG: Exonuclease small subunit [Bacteroidota bacterium]|jgi:exodeoxyribonuclease VII small subunit